MEEGRLAGLTIGGRVREGATLPPCEREEEQAVPAAPLGARRDNAATMNESRLSLLSRPTRGAKLCKRGKARLQVPPSQLCWEGEDPGTAA